MSSRSAAARRKIARAAQQPSPKSSSALTPQLPSPSSPTPSGFLSPSSTSLRLPPITTSSSGTRISSPLSTPKSAEFQDPSSSNASTFESQTPSKFSPESPTEFYYPSPSRASARSKPSTDPALKFKFKKNRTGKAMDINLPFVPSIDGFPDPAASPRQGRFRALLRRDKKEKKSPLASAPPSSDAPNAGVYDLRRVPYSNIGETRSSAQVLVAEIRKANTTALTTSSEVAWAKRHDTKLHPYPAEDVPYMQSYDHASLENDRYTELLLRTLTDNAPSFHNYGRSPPKTVLDLGCGKGHWALHASESWKKTQFFGLDIVDLTADIWPQDGVDRWKFNFVQGNFLTTPLPFEERTFDLVRMANLALCIPCEKWNLVLSEARRVLTIGGRLELIDDQIIFPYAVPPGSDGSSVASPMSERDMNVEELEELSELYDNFDIHDEEQTPGFYDHSPPPSHMARSPRILASGPSTFSLTSTWDQQAATARGVETVFEHMLTEKFKIHTCPSQLMLDIFKIAFGKRHSSLMKSIHVKLAPPENHELHVEDDSTPSYRSGSTLDVFSHCPGIVVWPSTFIPVPVEYLEMYACKHVHVLLSCKSAMADYVELRNDVRVVDEEFWEAFFDYSNFVRARFEPWVSTVSDDYADMCGATARHSPTPAADAVSVFSNESINEYQSLFGQRFSPDHPRVVVSDDSFHDNSGLSTPKTSSTTPSFFVSSHPKATLGVNDRTDTSRRHSSMSVVPPYSFQEPTHLRTFHIYEAIKLSDEVLS